MTANQALSLTSRSLMFLNRRPAEGSISCETRGMEAVAAAV